MEMHPQRPACSISRNHCGVYAATTAAIRGPTSPPACLALRLPFAALPRDATPIFVIPEESDQVRTTANGALGIFRSRDCGASWQPLTNGLPRPPPTPT